MQTYRALLLGGVCLGLVSLQATSKEMWTNEPDIRRAPEAGAAFKVATGGEDEEEENKGGEAAPAAAPAAEAVPATAEPELPMTPPGVTTYYGDTSDRETMPFRAEATMNPDYTADAPAAAPAETPAAEAAPAAAAESAPEIAKTEDPVLPMTPPGVTNYYGDTSDRETMPFRAEATMNPDYTAEAPAPAVAEVPATVAPELPMTPPGVTNFYGDTSQATPPAWAAEATVYPDTPAAQQAVEACRDALNAEAQAGKINFATSSWDVTDDSYRTLDKIAKVAKDCNSSFVIEVGGHTDNTGKSVSNKTISELRAQSVVKYLVRAGVDTAKLRAVGYGQDKPVAGNGTVAGRRQNRRIEFLVTGG